MKRIRIHPLGIVIIVIWCAIAVTTHSIALAAGSTTEERPSVEPSAPPAESEPQAEGAAGTETS